MEWKKNVDDSTTAAPRPLDRHADDSKTRRFSVSVHQSRIEKIFILIMSNTAYNRR